MDRYNKTSYRVVNLTVAFDVNIHLQMSAGWWFSLGTPVSSTNKTDDITEIVLKVALNTIILTLTLNLVMINP
jgi:hypothetical protein